MRRAFTLIELCVVVAMAGAIAAASLASMSSITSAARVNQQLAIVDLEVREARALALEQRAAYFVEPAATGILISRGTCSDPNTCTVTGGTGRLVRLPDLTTTGDVVVFNSDGRPPGSAAKVITFDGSINLEVGGAGTYRWLGGGELDGRIDGKQEIRLSAQEVAKQ